MKARAKHLASDQRGFTLAEVLVAMLMMLTVLFALYSIFDTSIRVFSFGNDKTEAVQNARLGMERMEREIRAAYPYDKAGGNEELFPNYFENPSDDITFGNDTDGDRRADDDQITYELDEDTKTLERNGSAAVENVEELSFDYLDEAGNDASDEEDIREVRIELLVEVDDGTQELTTDVALRNRSG